MHMVLQFASAPATIPWSGVLLVHSSADPNMTSAAGDLAAALLQLGLDVELHDVAHASDVDPDRHDVVIVGVSPGELGREEMAAWIGAHRVSLDDRPTALFTVARGGSKEARDAACGSVEALMAQTGWRPSRATVMTDAFTVDHFADDVAILAAAPLAA
jgi:menaquinone-dependent protoporphyrinogen IX oxidase